MKKRKTAAPGLDLVEVLVVKKYKKSVLRQIAPDAVIQFLQSEQGFLYCVSFFLFGLLVCIIN